MKKIFTLAATLILTSSIFAQAPEKMSYQSVIRDASNTLVTNQSVGIQISILQGSASGTSVYTETHAPTTNINGLASLEIGTGTIVTGIFSAINWGAGPYFIKTETDPTGGTAYTITGTSQLLSVPYALHAKAADSLVGLSSSDLAYLIGLVPPAPQIGDFRDGGVVFWIDPANPMHGLVCAVNDQSTYVSWGCQGTTIAGANGTAIGTGAANTSAIVLGCATTGIAAEIALNSTINGYTDWFLPSKDALNQMYLNKAAIDATATSNGGTAFNGNFYWSSSQSNNNTAWGTYFTNGITGGYNKGNPASYGMRVVRAF